jgi:tRNA(Ile)-lysidine synthase
LAVPRARLTATLEARGIPWNDDPSNGDLRFERARLRKRVLPLLEPEPGRAEREARLADAALDIVTVDPDGTLSLDAAAFRALDPDLPERLLGKLVRAIAGAEHLPRRERLARAAQRLRQAGDRGDSGRGQDFTLAQCKLLLRHDPDRRRLRWIVRPEHGRKKGRNVTQGLVPAAFFACGASPASHLERSLTVVEPAREPVQP